MVVAVVMRNQDSHRTYYLTRWKIAVEVVVVVPVMTAVTVDMKKKVLEKEMLLSTRDCVNDQVVTAFVVSAVVETAVVELLPVVSSLKLMMARIPY